MHPLAVFPRLLDFGFIAPLILRLVVAIFILSLARERYKKPNVWFTILATIFGILLVVGLYTQITAVVAIILIKFDFWNLKKVGGMSRDKIMLYTTMSIILLSLLVTGPGFLAFDLPL